MWLVLLFDGIAGVVAVVAIAAAAFLLLLVLPTTWKQALPAEPGRQGHTGRCQCCWQGSGMFTFVQLAHR